MKAFNLGKKRTRLITPKRLLLVGFLVLVAAALFFGEPRAWLRAAIEMVDDLGPWGPVLFVVAYVAATVLMVPGSALTVAAGTLFGVALGTGLVSLASTLGAAAAFLVGRFLARDAVAAKVADRPAFRALDRAIGRQGWKIVALSRLSPLLPFTVLNYAFGLTRVRFGHYVLASWIAMLPGTLLYVYLGSLARLGVERSGRTPLEWTFYGLGLVATVAVTVVITRAARKAIAEAGLAPDEASAKPAT